MSPHSSSKVSDLSASQDFDSRTQLSPKLSSFYDFAKKQYSSLIKEAAQSDDDQPVFTSSGVNYVKGSELTAKIALLATGNRKGETI